MIHSPNKLRRSYDTACLTDSDWLRSLGDWHQSQFGTQAVKDELNRIAAELETLYQQHQKELDGNLRRQKRIVELEKCCYQRGERMKIMREEWSETDWVIWTQNDCPEAQDWFDDNGEPT